MASRAPRLQSLKQTWAPLKVQMLSALASMSVHQQPLLPECQPLNFVFLPGDICARGASSCAFGRLGG